MTTIPSASTFERHYYYANKMIEKFCAQICNKQPSKEECKHCRIYLISSNMTYAYEMGWFTRLQNLMRHAWENRKEIIRKVKELKAKKEQPVKVENLGYIT